MSKSRIALFAILAGVSVIVTASQLALPGLLANHLKSLQDAQSASGSLTVQPLSGTEYTVKFKYAKPNMFRLDTDSGFTLSDGKSVYTYTKSSNSYTVAPADDAGVAATTGTTDVWAWAPFFNKDAYKDAQAKVGSKRTVKGTKVTEVAVSWLKPKSGEATIYFDDSNGGVKGFNIKVDDKEYIVFAENMVVSKDPVEAAAFAFVAPTDAKKVEVVEAAKAGYGAVQAILNKNCMPCHSAASHKSGINLSSYDAIVGNSEAVVAGEPDRSGIYRVTKSPGASMPKGRAPLSADDVKTIYDWIKDGAKN